MYTPKGKIVLVQDTANLLELITTILKDNGFSVIAATGVEEALGIVENHGASLVITNVLMPKLDGYVLVQRIRSNPLTAAIPVIFISDSLVTADDKKFAYSLGGVRFVDRPVDREELILTVGEVLAQGISTMPRPMGADDFQRGFRDRLEAVFRHKSTQIARAERLLQISAPQYRETLQSLLAQAISDRNQIQQELEAVYQTLNPLPPSPGE